MTPYGSFLYFGLLLYLVVVVVLARTLGVPARRIILGATIAMLAVQYGIADHGLVSAPLRAIAQKRYA